MKKICLFIMVLSIACCYISIGQGTGYVTLKGRQFYDAASLPFFPMVMNYHADIVHDQTSNPTTFKVTRSSAYGTMGCALEGGYTYADCENSLTQDFAKLHQMGFNSIRLLLSPHRKNGSLGFTYKSNYFADMCNENMQYTFDFNSPYNSASNQTFFNLVAHVLDIAENNNIKVIFLCSDGSSVGENDRGTSDIDALDYAQYLHVLASYLQNKPALLAYDLYNEPHWNVYDHNLTQSKQKVCEYTGWWYDAIKTSDQNHLVTIGGTDMGDVMDWDGSMMKVDFISMHLYPVYPDYENKDQAKATARVLDLISWCSSALQHPWIIGETGLSTSPDACINSYPGAADGEYTDQYNYIASILPAVRDCGGSGFSWWEFMDVHWYCIPSAICSTCTYCNTCGGIPSTPKEIHGNYWGLLQYADPVNYYSTADKPAVNFTIAFDEGNGTPAPAPCAAPTANYLDPYNCGLFNTTHHNAVTGTLKDANANPIKGGVVQALSWLYLDDNQTPSNPNDDEYVHTWFYYYADDNGDFEAIPYNEINIGDDRIIYIRGSAPVAEKFERGEAWGSINPDGWTDAQIQPAILGNITLDKINFQYDGVFDNENIPVSTQKNIKGWNSITVSNTTIDGISDITAREEININTEFHASATSEVHIFPSDAFIDCDATSTYSRFASNNSVHEENQLTNHNEIEIRFSKNKNCDFSIIPNPNNGTFSLEIYCNENNVATVSIKSILGKELQKFSSTKDFISLNLHDFPKGIYFVEAIIDNNKIVKKIIIN